MGGDFWGISPRFPEKVGEFLRESPAVEASISMKGARMCFRMGKCSVFMSIIGKNGSVCRKMELCIGDERRTAVVFVRKRKVY